MNLSPIKQLKALRIKAKALYKQMEITEDKYKASELELRIEEIEAQINELEYRIDSDELMLIGEPETEEPIGFSKFRIK